MRHDKAAVLLHLARALAGSAEGMTLDEMAAFSSEHVQAAGRRSAERMRDTLQSLFPQLEERTDGSRKRFRIPGGLNAFMLTPTVDELAELRASDRAQDGAGGAARAALLRGLSTKIEAAIRPGIRRRLAPDLEALRLAERDVHHVGPRPLADPAVLAAVRDAIKAVTGLRFQYDGRPRAASPWGLLYSRSYHLVGPAPGQAEPALRRLDRLAAPELDGPAMQPPPEWNLEAYVAQSFGVFQQPPRRVVLRFAPDAAVEAARFLFHPTQRLSPQPDGTLLVRFTAGGMLELAQHLFTWAPAVTILAPAALRQDMRSELAVALAHHAVWMTNPIEVDGLGLALGFQF